MACATRWIHGMCSNLSDLLGIKVDVAIKSNLRKRIGSRILHEAEGI